MAEELTIWDIKDSIAALVKSQQQTDIQIKEMSKSIKEAQELFTTQWGKLMETLVDGEIVKLFNENGINVVRTSTRVKRIYVGKNYEFDIIAHDGDEIIVVEVKTTLKSITSINI